MSADRIDQQTFDELDSRCSVGLILISESVALFGFLDELNSLKSEANAEVRKSFLVHK